MISQQRLHPPFKNENLHVIYCITNKHTGKSYVGKTVKPFTSRWYEHFFCSPLKGRYNTKFGMALRGSKITDWWFRILEKIEYPEGVTENQYRYRMHILCRECFWMDELNSIKDGYNVSYSTNDYEPGMFDTDWEFKKLLANLSPVKHKLPEIIPEPRRKNYTDIEIFLRSLTAAVNKGICANKSRLEIDDTINERVFKFLGFEYLPKENSIEI